MALARKEALLFNVSMMDQDAHSGQRRNNGRSGERFVDLVPWAGMWGRQTKRDTGRGFS